jgi:hypothetical protein
MNLPTLLLFCHIWILLKNNSNGIIIWFVVFVYFFLIFTLYYEISATSLLLQSIFFCFTHNSVRNAFLVNNKGVTIRTNHIFLLQCNLLTFRIMCTIHTTYALIQYISSEVICRDNSRALSLIFYRGQL